MKQTVSLQKNMQNIQLRREVIQSLNLQYRTETFKPIMSPHEIVQCAQQAMRVNLDSIDYELNGAIIDHYRIKTKICEESPFPQQQAESLNQLIHISEKLMCQLKEYSGIVNKRLEQLKDYVVNLGTKIKLSQRYHKYLLYFKYINIKEAIIFEVLARCQVFFTITRERKKSGKEYYMDPLINCFEDIRNKLNIQYPFHQSVLPRRQLRFFEKKITDKRMKNTLFDAVSNRRYDEVKELIAKGASIEEPGINERQQKREMNCSHRACQLGDLQMCRILHAYKVNWQVKQKQGMTPLHFAAQSGNLQLVKFLVEEAKVRLQPRDSQERTPFYFACTEGDLDIIKYLYEKGCDINNKSKLGRSALSKACYLGLVDVVNFLMGCPGINISVADGKGRTALHNAVFGPKGGREGHKFGTNQKDSPQCTQLLLENGFNVDFEDKQQNTPLHVSMSSDGIDSIRVLLAFGASLTKLNCYGETPLMTGAKFGHLDSVKVLREQFGSSITVKDIFNKNLMLLCAKFRQDDGKCVNSVFYYSTDQLLEMARTNQPLQISKNTISNWQQQIDYTFSQLLKQNSRVEVQFKYFCYKLMEKKLQITHLKLQHIKLLFDLIKDKEDKEFLQIAQYVITKRSFERVLKVTLVELQEFVRWILLENSVNLVEFVKKIQVDLKRYLAIEDSKEQFCFVECLSSQFFSLIPQLKEKVISYCLLRMNINWLDYIDSQYYHNIIHLLVRSKKVGSLIQILKMLSGVKMDFISNEYVIALLQEEDLFRKDQQQGQQSPLGLIMKSMLLHKDRQGFDPYRLALLIKDASASKLLEEKINKQAGFNKAEFQVKEFSYTIETDPGLIQEFNKGYEIEAQLEKLMGMVEQSSRKQIAECFILLESNQPKDSFIDDFKSACKAFHTRTLHYISDLEDIPLLYQLEKERVVGLDIQYFYTEGVTLISIMQLSTLTQDYIVDFLRSAKEKQSSQLFIQAVRKALVGMAYNPKIMKIMHGSDNDLCVIKSVLKFSFLNFLDTARVDIELRKQQNIRGLATLVKQYLGEHMSKDYQVSEWRIRPIPSSMLEYARKDSFVLPYLARVMLSLLPNDRVKQTILGGCKQARRNKKASQPLIKSIQAL